jgi:hypothetical protein
LTAINQDIPSYDFYAVTTSTISAGHHTLKESCNLREKLEVAYIFVTSKVYHNIKRFGNTIAEELLNFYIASVSRK